MQKKNLLLVLIVFVAVGLISYFATQPATQTAQASMGNDAIKGNIYYNGSGCQHMTGDHVKVYRWTESGAQFIYNQLVTSSAGAWRYVIGDDDIGQIAGYYRLNPTLYAAGSTGISPQVRDSVWWEPEMVRSGQHFTAVTCNQQGPEQP